MMELIVIYGSPWVAQLSIIGSPGQQKGVAQLETKGSPVDIIVAQFLQ